MNLWETAREVGHGIVGGTIVYNKDLDGKSLTGSQHRVEALFEIIPDVITYYDYA
jgi:hypothetical protein